MTFSFFLSIYSRCGAPASWAARHTTVCLELEDEQREERYIYIMLKSIKFDNLEVADEAVE